MTVQWQDVSVQEFSAVVCLCTTNAAVNATKDHIGAQGGLDTVEIKLALVFFLPPTSANTPCALMVVITSSK